jgi:hypothetical protein
MAMRWLRILLTAVTALGLGTTFCWAAEAIERPAMPPIPPHVPSQVKLPEVTKAGVIRIAENSGHTVKLDLTSQVLHVEAPKQDDWRTPEDIRIGDTVKTTRKTRLMSGSKQLAELASGSALPVVELKEGWVRTASAGKLGWIAVKDVALQASDPRISPTLREAISTGTVSYAVLAQKCKQFDDGLYAAVELAAENGLGEFAGKKQFLAQLSEALLADRAAADSKAADLVYGASRLAGVPPTLSSTGKRRVDSMLSQFQADPLRSKPLGFYTWSSDLRTIFQQDRLLQSEIENGPGAAAMAAALQKNAELRKTYEQYLELISRLTNPLTAPDLRSLADAGSAPPKVHIFPASVSHETELVKRLYGTRPIPDDFSLADELVAQVKAGKIDLTPSTNSGWYDYQTWSLESLVLPERTPEAERLEFGEEYRKLLVELFKGVLALTRETHVKQLEFPPAAAAAELPEKEKPKLFIGPEVSVEPLATAYLRRALAYRFVRNVIANTFGESELSKLRRLTAGGPVETPLDQELEAMEGLLHGAYVTACRQIGMPEGEAAAELGRDAAKDAAAYLDWGANLGRDADVGQDARMMVPVFYDLQRKKTKVWAFLGWAPRDVSISYAKPPKLIAIHKGDDEVSTDDVEVHYVGSYNSQMYPVVADVYVTKLLDRDEFRKHCDLYRTRGAILGNLQ